MAVSSPPPEHSEEFYQAELLGYPVHVTTSDKGLAYIENALDNDERLHVVTLNPEMMMQADKDPELAGILKHAGLVLPDGAGVVWALRSRGHHLKRLPGIEFSEKLLAMAEEKNYRVALIGASFDVLTGAIVQLQKHYPKLHIVYAHPGFFPNKDMEDAVAEACAKTQPQIVLVAMGVPKQEKWIEHYKQIFPQAVCIGVGGSLDVWSGMSKRAPEILRKLNLEWFYRIATEPWRIQRIYKSLPLFVVKVLLNRG